MHLRHPVPDSKEWIEYKSGDSSIRRTRTRVRLILESTLFFCFWVRVRLILQSPLLFLFLSACASNTRVLDAHALKNKKKSGDWSIRRTRTQKQK